MWRFCERNYLVSDYTLRQCDQSRYLQQQQQHASVTYQKRKQTLTNVYVIIFISTELYLHDIKSYWNSNTEKVCVSARSYIILYIGPWIQWLNLNNFLNIGVFQKNYAVEGSINKCASNGNSVLINILIHTHF